MLGLEGGAKPAKRRTCFLSSRKKSLVIGLIPRFVA